MNYNSIDPPRGSFPPGSANLKSDEDAAVENVAIDEAPALLLPSPSSPTLVTKFKGRDKGDELEPPKQQDEQDENAQPRSWRGFARTVKVVVFERNFGLFLILMAQFFASIMALTTRMLETRYEFHALQILFVRMFVTAGCGSTFMWLKSVPDFPLGARNIRWLLVLRGCAGFIGVFGLYYSLAYLDLADAIVITFLVPTVASLGCWLVLHEPFTKPEAFAGLVAFVGVLFIARPPFLFPASGEPSESPDDGIPEVSPSQRLIAVSLALVGIFGAATAYTTIRWIGKRAHALISVNYFAGVTTVVSFVVIMLHPGLSFKIPKEPMEWILLTVIGFTGFVMQFLLTAGLQREKASRATNMVYTQLIFALIWERWIFGTVPAWQSVVGCALILVAAVWVATQRSKGDKEKNQADAATDPRRPVESNDEERALLLPREDDR